MDSKLSNTIEPRTFKSKGKTKKLDTKVNKMPEEIPSDNYSPGLRINIKSEKEVTIDDLVQEANEIWMRVLGKTPIEDIAKKYPQFYQSYSIIIQYMYIKNIFVKEIFRNWLLKVQENPWKTTEDYFKSHADYLTELYFYPFNDHLNYSKKEKNKEAKWLRIEKDKFRAEMFKALKDNHEDFIATHEEVKEKVDKKDMEFRRKNREELFDFFMKFPIENQSSQSSSS